MRHYCCSRELGGCEQETDVYWLAQLQVISDSNLRTSTLLTIFRHSTMESMNIQVNRIKMSDYEQHHYDKDLLRQSGELSNLLLFFFVCSPF